MITAPASPLFLHPIYCQDEITRSIIQTHHGIVVTAWRAMWSSDARTVDPLWGAQDRHLPRWGLTTRGHARVRPTAFSWVTRFRATLPPPPPQRATRRRAAAPTVARDTRVRGSARRHHGAERACEAGDDRRAHGPRGGAPPSWVVPRGREGFVPVPRVGVQVGAASG